MLLAYVTCMCSESPGRGTRLVELDGSLPNQSIMLRVVMGLLQRAWLGKSPSSSPVIVSVSRHQLVPLASEQAHTSSSLCDNLFCMNDIYKGP